MFCLVAGHECYAAAEGAIKLPKWQTKYAKSVTLHFERTCKDAVEIISRINGFTYVETQSDYGTGELKEVNVLATAMGPRKSELLRC